LGWIVSCFRILGKLHSQRVRAAATFAQSRAEDNGCQQPPHILELANNGQGQPIGCPWLLKKLDCRLLGRNDGRDVLLHSRDGLQAELVDEHLDHIGGEKRRQGRAEPYVLDAQ